MPFTTRLIRKLGRKERRKICDHFLRLVPQDRRMRFFGAVGDDFVAAYAQRLCRHNNLVLGCFVGGELRALGELHIDGQSAEAAITVEHDFQNTGIGTELLHRLLELARNRLIVNVHLTCLADNTRVQQITRKSGAVLSQTQGTVEANIAPPWPSLWSIFTEVLGDQQTMLSRLLANDGGLPALRYTLAA